MSTNIRERMKAKQRINEVTKYFIWQWDSLLEEWKIVGYLTGYPTRKEAEDERRKYLGEYINEPYAITKTVIISTNIVALLGSSEHELERLR